MYIRNSYIAARETFGERRGGYRDGEKVRGAVGDEEINPNSKHRAELARGMLVKILIYKRYERRARARGG